MVTTFTPFASLLGGLLIGLSAVLLMALHGRIMGATGILGGVLRWPEGGAGGDWALRMAVLAGMVAGPSALALAGRAPDMAVPIGPLAVALGGLIVGVGVGYGGGCTSGHGVCGLARLSRRSAVATATFMAAAVLTVFVTRHLIGAA